MYRTIEVTILSNNVGEGARIIQQFLLLCGNRILNQRGVSEKWVGKEDRGRLAPNFKKRPRGSQAEQSQSATTILLPLSCFVLQGIGFF